MDRQEAFSVTTMLKREIATLEKKLRTREKEVAAEEAKLREGIESRIQEIEALQKRLRGGGE